MKISASALLSFLLIAIILTTILNITIAAEYSRSLADRFFYNNQYQKAVSLYLKVLEDDDTNSDLFFRVGLCYLMLGKHEDALLIWGKALALNSDIGDDWNFHVPGNSMEPTIMKGDVIFVDQEFYDHQEISQGDVVMFIFPEDTNEVWIRRVIGLPGDEVSIKDKKVYINGIKLVEESYTIFTSTVSLRSRISPKDNLGPIRIPTGQYFLLGDNRDNSSDSRFWGPVKRDFILGKALVIFGTASTNQSVADSFERMGRIIK